MTETTIDQISIKFSDDSLLLLNICLGFIMFGIALGIEISDFKKVAKKPAGPVVGIISQFALLPIFTVILVAIVSPHPAFALGMILVACCPGGNVSNFISSLSGANVALSVTLTGIATLLTPIITPLNFDLCAGILPETATYLRSFNLSYLDILKTVALLLILPLILGLWFNHRFAHTSKKVEKPIRILSVLILFGFIAVAIANNFGAFKDYFGHVFLLVLLHNGIAFLIGYLSGKAAGLPEAERRTICIETGIQNSGLGLIIIFTFFDGNGGMAIIAAWWGIWHIIAGLAISRYFKIKGIPQNAVL